MVTSYNRRLARVLYEYEMQGVPHPRWEVLDRVMQIVFEKKATKLEHLIWDANLQLEINQDVGSS